MPPRSGALLAALALFAQACASERQGGPSSVALPSLGIEVPVPEGFVRDRNAETKPSDAGGILLRLVRSPSVPGSPRLDVVAGPRRDRPLTLEEFLTQNLAEMTALEGTGGLRITRVEQAAISIGPRRGYRVRHEYTLSGAEVAITQVSTLLVLDGRGVAITAVGRTELLVPLAPLLESALSGIGTPMPGQRAADAPSLLQPIDLHRVVDAPKGN